MMKRLIGAALALSLLGTTADSAQPWHGSYRGGYSHGYGGYRHGNGAGVALGLGLGLFALAAIAASNDHDRYDERYQGGYYNAPPPPPPYQRGW